MTSQSMTGIEPRAPGRPRPGAAVWVGRVLSGLAIAFMLMDGLIKLPPIQPVTQTLAAIGWPADAATARGLGVLALVLTGLYAWPRTALLGAVLLTGYLGGAVATHLRIGSPLFSHVLFGVYIGALVWGGLWLRSPALRALAPIRRPGLI